MTSILPTATVSATSGGLLYQLHHRGVIGYGEASPLPGMSPDNLEQCRAALTVAPPPRLDLAAPLLEQILDHSRQVAPPAARFGFESAALDLAGKLSGQPAWRLLRPTGSPPAPIAINALVDSLAAARAAVARGITTLKLKVARRQWRVELELIDQIAGAFGARARLRLDANRGWSRAEARQHLEELVDYRLEYVEEPSDDLLGLESKQIDLAVDESLSGDLEIDFGALHRAGVRAAVLKPPLLGGITPTMALAAAARRAGVEPLVSHMMGGPVELAACCELALALAPRLACGLDRHRRLADWPGWGIARLGDNQLCSGADPGLGLIDIAGAIVTGGVGD